uniref:Uncharacterized protein n=1 Tax=Rhizophora mucronata TaxID=61149 RepID=A0A2P2MN59_RHIMU
MAMSEVKKKKRKFITADFSCSKERLNNQNYFSRHANLQSL